MDERQLETRRGIKTRVLEAGAGRPLVYLHGAGACSPRSRCSSVCPPGAG